MGGVKSGGFSIAADMRVSTHLHENQLAVCRRVQFVSAPAIEIESASKARWSEELMSVLRFTYLLPVLVNIFLEIDRFHKELAIISFVWGWGETAVDC